LRLVGSVRVGESKSCGETWEKDPDCENPFAHFVKTVVSKKRIIRREYLQRHVHADEQNSDIYALSVYKTPSSGETKVLTTRRERGLQHEPAHLAKWFVALHLASPKINRTVDEIPHAFVEVSKNQHQNEVAPVISPHHAEPVYGANRRANANTRH
jgi:hypothetical protein